MSEAAKVEAKVGHFMRWWWGWAVGGLVLYAFAQPLLACADPARLLHLGFAAGCVVMFGYAETLLEGREARVCFYALIGFAAWTTSIVSDVLSTAVEVSAKNDRRCLLIEVEMMRGKPRRDDLPDMFQAFRCQPQTRIMPHRPAK